MICVCFAIGFVVIIDSFRFEIFKRHLLQPLHSHIRNLEPDTREEAEQIAKDRALEDIDWNNCECDTGNPIVYCCNKEKTEDE